MSSNNTNRNGFLMYPQSCVSQNVYGFDAFDLFNPFTKFRPDSFPFGSNWYYFCALHFVTAIMLNVLSNTESETQKKHKSFIESLVFGIYVTTLGVSANQMAVSYTKGNNIYYNIQDMSLMFIALFRMVTTTSFHLLIMQPNIQKTELMRWKGLIDLTYTALCTVLFIVLICFSLLPTDFCPIFAVTVTLFVLLTSGQTSGRELRDDECKYSFRNCLTLQNVIFLIVLLHLTCTCCSIDEERAPWPIKYCCQYQNFTFKCITDWALFLNCSQNIYVNDKMLPTKNNIDKMATCKRKELTLCDQVSLLMIGILPILPILTNVFVFKRTDISPFDFLCYNESVMNLFVDTGCTTHSEAWCSLDKSWVYDKLCTNRTD